MTPTDPKCPKVILKLRAFDGFCFFRIVFRTYSLLFVGCHIKKANQHASWKHRDIEDKTKFFLKKNKKKKQCAPKS